MYGWRIPAPAILIAVLGLLILGRYWYDQQQPSMIHGRHLQLVEGEYEIVDVHTDLTLLVRPLRGNPGQAFKIKLAAIRPSAPAGPKTVSQLVRKMLSGRKTELRFDRQRFGADRMPLAYVLADGQLVNAELILARLARAAPIPGNSSPLQRQIIRAGRLADSQSQQNRMPRPGKLKP